MFNKTKPYHTKPNQRTHTHTHSHTHTHTHIYIYIYTCVCGFKNILVLSKKWSTQPVEKNKHKMNESLLTPLLQSYYSRVHVLQKIQPPIEIF